jgi:hypothetical protein
MTDNTQFQEELHRSAAEMLKAKLPDYTIVENLKRKGLDAYYAEMILENVKTDVEDRKQFRKHMLSGGFVFLAGLALTIGTYFMAGPGETYYIFPGIMVVGIGSMIRGFILFRK